MTDSTATGHDLNERYAAARALLRAWQNTTVGSVDGDAIDDAGRSLNLKRSHWSARLNDIRSAILADQVIFGVRRRGKNLVQRAFEREEHDKFAGSWSVEDAVRRLRYRILRVKGPGDGIRVPTEDVLRAMPVTLIDVQMSRVAAEGMAVAGRMVPFDDCEMFTGAAIPVQGEAGRVLVEKIMGHGLLTRCRNSHKQPMSADEEADLAALCIRTLLALGCDRSIRYADADSPTDESTAAAE